MDDAGPAFASLAVALLPGAALVLRPPNTLRRTSAFRTDRCRNRGSDPDLDRHLSGALLTAKRYADDPLRHRRRPAVASSARCTDRLSQAASPTRPSGDEPPPRAHRPPAHHQPEQRTHLHCRVLGSPGRVTSASRAGPRTWPAWSCSSLSGTSRRRPLGATRFLIRGSPRGWGESLGTGGGSR